MQEQTIETDNPQIESQEIETAEESTDVLGGSESQEQSNEEQGFQKDAEDASDDAEGREEGGEEGQESLLIDLGAGEGDDTDSDDTEEVQFADLRAYVVAGKTDEALKRISAHEKGLAQLRSKFETQSHILAGMESTFKAIAEGDVDAMLTFEDNFEKTFGKRPNITIDDVETKPERRDDPKVSVLEKEVAELKTRLEVKDWSSGLGKEISEVLKKATGLEISPDVLWKAKQFLPKSGQVTPQVVEDAVMQADPQAYRKARDARDAKQTSRRTIPKGAVLEKGSKPTQQDAKALLEPGAFVKAYRAQQAKG